MEDDDIEDPLDFDLSPRIWTFRDIPGFFFN